MGRGLTVAFGLALLGAAAPAAAQAVAERGPVTMRPDDSEMLQDAATVVVVSQLEHQGDLSAKLFGAASGDPAMNGLNTYLAFFEPPPVNGWRIFEVGDFLSYDIVSETPGRLLLEIHESVMNDNGEIGERTRRLAVSWTPGRDGAPPATVTVATAPPAGAATPQGH
jgi:hypothetical protein